MFRNIQTLRMIYMIESLECLDYEYKVVSVVAASLYGLPDADIDDNIVFNSNNSQQVIRGWSFVMPGGL